MLHSYQHRSQYVQHFPESESECESESGSGSEEEQEQELVESGRQHVLTQRRDANELRQCGSAVGGASCNPQPALENYFTHLTEQYSCSLALDGHTRPMSSHPKPKHLEEKSGCTCTDDKVQFNTNRSTVYPQNNNYGHTYFAQEDRMVPISSKPTTPKKGSTLVNNGRVGHVLNNNNDSRYISQGDSTIPLSSRSKINKGKIESVYAYDESQFDNNRHLGYGADYLMSGYYIPPPDSKPKLTRGKIESGYAYDESEFDNNQHVVYGSREYCDMMYNGTSKKSSTSTSPTTSNKRLTYM